MEDVNHLQYVRQARNLRKGCKYKLFAVEKSVCNEFSGTQSYSFFRLQISMRVVKNGERIDGFS